MFQPYINQDLAANARCSKHHKRQKGCRKTVAAVGVHNSGKVELRVREKKEADS
jgi:hypothetical protein